MAQPHRAPHPEPRRVLSGAVTRAALLLEVNQVDLAQILGVSPATVSRLAHGAYLLDEGKKEWELGALFVRVFRSIDALVGGNDVAARTWLNGANQGLQGRPVEMIRSTEGLVRVVQYLDAARGRI